MSKRMKIAFSINDWTEQELELTTDDYTLEEVFGMLERGEAVTSLQEGGEVLVVEKGELVKVAKVVSNEQGDGSYFDFELLWVDEG